MDDKLELAYGLLSVFNTQTIFEYIIKKHKILSDIPTIRI